jgi:hypothetical protein
MSKGIEKKIQNEINKLIKAHNKMMLFSAL